jgi:hypothetical protein
MNRFDELHEEAMTFADRGDEARQNGDEADARTLFRRALEKEREALRALGATEEPSRSVLLRSAASLAIDADDLDEAVAIIEEGLRGQPPRAIRLELESLRVDVEVQRVLGRVPTGVPPWARFDDLIDENSLMHRAPRAA